MLGFWKLEHTLTRSPPSCFPSRRGSRTLGSSSSCRNFKEAAEFVGGHAQRGGQAAVVSVRRGTQFVEDATPPVVKEKIGDVAGTVGASAIGGAIGAAGGAVASHARGTNGTDAATGSNAGGPGGDGQPDAKDSDDLGNEEGTEIEETNSIESTLPPSIHGLGEQVQVVDFVCTFASCTGRYDVWSLRAQENAYYVGIESVVIPTINTQVGVN
ncbi:hypothetical protein B0H16DRAFT_1461014 [Mycena metata]|uniref:Uncharacterized protein n=1 Tax=Mycena metata TaxID=1033252 RepID=A0AAD7N983_9AGAR|nr:hypothetical protein B0H16DRAFT_1461014 [Mycena metata]